MRTTLPDQNKMDIAVALATLSLYRDRIQSVLDYAWSQKGTPRTLPCLIPDLDWIVRSMNRDLRSMKGGGT